MLGKSEEGSPERQQFGNISTVSRTFSKAFESPDTEFFPVKIRKNKGACESGMKLKTGKILVIDA